MKSSSTICENTTFAPFSPVVALGANWIFDNPGEGNWTIVLAWGHGIKYRKERIIKSIRTFYEVIYNF